MQFARRDYQHRTRLAALTSPDLWQWLSISTHLPYGRCTLIHQARIIDPRRCARRTRQMVHQYYRASSFWAELDDRLGLVVDMFDNTDRTCDVAEASTRMMLDMLGWQGTILHSTQLPSRTGRSRRLADLASTTRASAYLCGTGGMRYLDPSPFREAGIKVAPFRVPADGVWTHGRTISGLSALMCCGPDELVAQLHACS